MSYRHTRGITLHFLVNTTTSIRPLSNIVLNTTLRVTRPRRINTRQIFLLMVFSHPLSNRPPTYINQTNYPLTNTMTPRNRLNLFPLFLYRPHSPPTTTRGTRIPLKQHRLRRQKRNIHLTSLRVHFSNRLILRYKNTSTGRLYRVIRLRLPIPGMMFSLYTVYRTCSPFYFPRSSHFAVFDYVV